MKLKHILIFIVVGAGLTWSTGCRKHSGSFVGNNDVVTETRRMVSFNQIVSEGKFNVFVSYDTVYQLIVEAESNLIPYIRTIVNGNTLVIDTREYLSNNYPLNIYVTTPYLNSVVLEGSGNFTLDSLQSDNFRITNYGAGNIRGMVTASTVFAMIEGAGNLFLELHSPAVETHIEGAGNIDLTGETEDGRLFIEGAGNVNAYNFVQKNCLANISGSGNMYLNVTDFLDVNISGSGSVFYIGDPEIVVTITGSGSVVKQ